MSREVGGSDTLDPFPNQTNRRTRPDQGSSAVDPAWTAPAAVRMLELHE